MRKHQIVTEKARVKSKIKNRMKLNNDKKALRYDVIVSLLLQL